MSIIKSLTLSILWIICSATGTNAGPGNLFLKKKPKPLIQKLYGTISLGDGIGFSGSLFTRGHNLYTLRYLHEDKSLIAAPFWQASPQTHLEQIGIMYGKGINIWRFFLDASAGAAYLNYHTDYDLQKKASMGLIANMQASYALKTWMAIGIELYGYLNVYQSRTGVLLNLHFGMLR